MIESIAGIINVLQSGQQDWFNHSLRDGGPVYMETNPNHFIAEPWNAVSSLVIIFPALIWLYIIRNEFRDHRFLLFCIPLMILGGTGSTLFHAFRVSRIFLYLDIMPTAILTLSISIYFWYKVQKKWWAVILVVVPVVIFRFILVGKLHRMAAINISYAITGIIIALPLLIILFKTRFYKYRQVVLTILFFIAALFFREIDPQPITWLPMGTHFLWHIFSGIGAYFILSYLYYFRKRELKIQADQGL